MKKILLIGSIVLVLGLLIAGFTTPMFAHGPDDGEATPANEEAWEATLSTGQATFYSRSRQKIWVKGETSGNRQIVKEIRIDCDNDSILLMIDQIGGASCHTGYRSCFYKQVKDGSTQNIGKPVFDPEEVYGK